MPSAKKSPSRRRVSTRGRARRRVGAPRPDRLELIPFDAATAFEDLRGDLIDVEALAGAAGTLLEYVPLGRGTADQRRQGGRLYALVQATATAAEAALARSEEVQARLNAHMIRVRRASGR